MYLYFVIVFAEKSEALANDPYIFLFFSFFYKKNDSVFCVPYSTYENITFVLSFFEYIIQCLVLCNLDLGHFLAELFLLTALHLHYLE